MNSFELQIKTGAITTNLESLKEELTEIAQRYDGVVVSEQSVPLAKKDLAELRKIVKEIEDRRKSVKKEWNIPYTEFEKEVKTALEIINKPIELIDKQVKEYEAQAKAEKEQHIREIYAEQVKGYEDYLPFADNFNEKWLNVSTSDKDIIFDVNGLVTKVKMDLDAIEALQTEFKDEVIKAYKQSGNQLSAAIQRNTQLISAKAIAEQKVKDSQDLVKDLVKEEPMETLPFDEDRATFTVWGADNLLKVRLFLQDNNIKYEERY